MEENNTTVNTEYEPHPDAKYGIEQTKDVIKLVVELGQAIEKSLQDGKFDASDLRYFMQPIMSLPEAYRDMEQVPEEIEDLDRSEVEKLVQYTNEILNLENQDLEDLMKEALNVGYAIYIFSLKLRDILNKE